MSNLRAAIRIGGLMLLCLTTASEAADPDSAIAVAEVRPGSKISIEFKLTLEDGKMVNNNLGGKPLEIIHGAHQIVFGLEEALLGMKIGERKTVTVPPEKGFGLVDQDLYQQVPISEIPEEGRVVGGTMEYQDGFGRGYPVVIESIEGEVAKVNFNHPLAGHTLTYDVKVVSVQ